MKYYCILKQLSSILIYFKMQLIPVMAKLNIQQPLLKSSVSHDPSEIILICLFGAQERFLIIFSVESSCAVQKNKRTEKK